MLNNRKSSMHIFRLFGIATCLFFAVTSHAGESGRGTHSQVELQAEAQREVQNDLLNATLFVELNDQSPAALASHLNQRMTQALQTAKKFPAVRARSGNTHTFPVYARSNVLQGWRGRAEIRIESRDFDAAATLIGELQSSLQLAGISFAVSQQTRRAAENELTVEAITAFKARAEIVRGALAGESYRIQRLNLQHGHNIPQPRFAMARAATATQEVAPPTFEAGVSLVTVTASGVIELR